MKMIHCTYYLKKAQPPKFYYDVLEQMEEANNSVFVSQDELDIFVTMLKQTLEEQKPGGHPACVVHTQGLKGGRFTLWSGEPGDDVAYLDYHPIARFLKFDLEERDFFDASNLYEIGG